MICDNCKTERLITDFINNQKICYHCVYRIKLSKITKNRTSSNSTCRLCNKEFVQLENLKKRQRTVFCSRECALKGHKQQIKNHWTRKACGGSTYF